jgi:hypothetical protein
MMGLQVFPMSNTPNEESQDGYLGDDEEDEATLWKGIQIRVMDVVKLDESPTPRKNSTNDIIAATVVDPDDRAPERKDSRRYRLIASGKKRMRPTVAPEEKECLVTWVKVGDLEAWALWDSGSTTSGVTPAFAELAKLKVDTLTDPHILQLGTVGSRSIIKYGADVPVEIASHKFMAYVDVANFDRYDMIIGTPMMRRNKVLLDFDKDRVIVNGIAIPAIKVKEPNLDPRLHRHRTTDKKTKVE